MKAYASKVINYAKTQVGYLEKASNAHLESKTANAGMNNYTIYGERRGLNGEPWCDEFVDDSMIQAYGKEKASELLGGFSAYTPDSAQRFKNMGRYDKKPAYASIIFFYSKTMGRICHTGFVYKVDSKNRKVYTIEGNTSSGPGFERNGGCVAYKVYDFDDKHIDGYGHPKYDTVTKVEVKLSCHLYKKVSTTAGYYATLSKGTKLTFIKDLGNGWSKAKYDGKTGFVKNTALAKSGLSAYKTTTVVKEAKFRKSNSVKSAAMRTLKPGTKLTVIYRGKFWSLCVLDGIKGFVYTAKIK